MGDADLAKVRSVAQAQDDAGLNGDGELGRCGNAALGIGIRLIFHPNHGLGAAEGSGADALDAQQILALILRVVNHRPLGSAGALDLISPGKLRLRELDLRTVGVRKGNTGCSGVPLIDLQRRLLDDKLQVHGNCNGQVSSIGRSACGIGRPDDNRTGHLRLYGYICCECGIVIRARIHHRRRVGRLELLGPTLGIVSELDFLRTVVGTRYVYQPQLEYSGSTAAFISLCRRFRILRVRLGLLGLLLPVRLFRPVRFRRLRGGPVLEQINGSLVFHPVQAQHRPAAIVHIDRFAEGVGLGQNRREGIVQAVQQLLVAWEAVLSVDGKAVFGGRHRVETFLALGVIPIQQIQQCTIGKVAEVHVWAAIVLIPYCSIVVTAIIIPLTVRSLPCVHVPLGPCDSVIGRPVFRLFVAFPIF